MEWEKIFANGIPENLYLDYTHTDLCVYVCLYIVHIQSNQQ